MSDLRTLEKLKLIAEHNLEMAKEIKERYPRLEGKYRNLVAKISMEIAEVKAKSATNGTKEKRRGEV